MLFRRKTSLKMVEQQEPSDSIAYPPSPPLGDTQFIDLQLMDSPPSPSPSASEFLKELDTHYTNHPSIDGRYLSPSDKKLLELPRRDKSSTAIFQIGPDGSGSLSPSPIPRPKANQTSQDAAEDIDDNCSIGTTASWIIENLDFKTPSSSEVDEEEERGRKREDPLFERGQPEFIFPFPDGSGELPKYLKRERNFGKAESGEGQYKGDEEMEETKCEDGFTAIPEDVDQVALAALITAFMFGGMWALENGYAKALMFQ